MKDEASYQDKIKKYKNDLNFELLAEASQEGINQLLRDFRITFQELRKLIESARDFEIWQEEGITSRLEKLLREIPKDLGSVQRKKRILNGLFAEHSQLQAAEKRYPSEGLRPPDREKLDLVVEDSDKNIFGLCPAYSDKTVCCGLYTLDAVENCPFRCSYCTIQTFYGNNAVFQKNLKSKLEKISLDPNRFYHIGTGQSSDALVWGNENGLLDDLFQFAESHPGVLLELKTKSASVDFFLENSVPDNVVCSWTLNTETIIKSEEHYTASLSERLEAAGAVAESGTKVAFHFHPLVYYQGWEEDYSEVAGRVLDLFNPEQVLFVSFGTVTFIKPVIKEIRRRGACSKITQMEMVHDPMSKFTYPDALKIKLYQTIYQAFSEWHEQVFFYLCMEKGEIWDQVLGRHYEDNEQFNEAYGQAVGLKGVASACSPRKKTYA